MQASALSKTVFLGLSRKSREEVELEKESPKQASHDIFGCLLQTETHLNKKKALQLLERIRKRKKKLKVLVREERQKLIIWVIIVIYCIHIDWCNVSCITLPVQVKGLKHKWIIALSEYKKDSIIFMITDKLNWNIELNHKYLIALSVGIKNGNIYNYWQT